MNKHAKYTVTVRQVSTKKQPWWDESLEWLLFLLGVKSKMANPTSIAAGGTGKFQAQLSQNGVAIALPAGATWTWTLSDPLATKTVDPSDATGGTLDVSIPATDNSTQIQVTATANLTSGPVNGSATSTITQTFTVAVTQIA